MFLKRVSLVSPKLKGFRLVQLTILRATFVTQGQQLQVSRSRILFHSPQVVYSTLITSLNYLRQFQKDSLFQLLPSMVLLGIYYSSHNLI